MYNQMNAMNIHDVLKSVSRFIKSFAAMLVTFTMLSCGHIWIEELEWDDTAGAGNPRGSDSNQGTTRVNTDTATIGDTNTGSALVNTDTETATGPQTTDSDTVFYDPADMFYSGPVERVPLFAPEGERFIASDSNALGVQGRWFNYFGENSTTFMSGYQNDGFSINGEVASAAQTGYAYIGMGMGWCFEPGTGAHPLQDCPVTTGLQDLIVGFSFEVSGTYPTDGSLELIVLTSDSPNMLFWDIGPPGSYEILFSEMNIRMSDTPLTVGQFDRIQFQLGHHADAVIGYDFHVANLAVLRRPE